MGHLCGDLKEIVVLDLAGLASTVLSHDCVVERWVFEEKKVNTQKSREFERDSEKTENKRRRKSKRKREDREEEDAENVRWEPRKPRSGDPREANR
jgi:hypothetical protein